MKKLRSWLKAKMISREKRVAKKRLTSQILRAKQRHVRAGSMSLSSLIEPVRTLGFAEVHQANRYRRRHGQPLIRVTAKERLANWKALTLTRAERMRQHA